MNSYDFYLSGEKLSALSSGGLYWSERKYSAYLIYILVKHTASTAPVLEHYPLMKTSILLKDYRQTFVRQIQVV